MGKLSSKTVLIDATDYERKAAGLEIQREVWIGSKCLMEVKEESNSSIVKSNVIYASMITAKARILLWKHLTGVTKSGGRLLYCDTDSIFAAYPKNKKLKAVGPGEII